MRRKIDVFSGVYTIYSLDLNYSVLIQSDDQHFRGSSRRHSHCGFPAYLLSVFLLLITYFAYLYYCATILRNAAGEVSRTVSNGWLPSVEYPASSCHPVLHWRFKAHTGGRYFHRENLWFASRMSPRFERTHGVVYSIMVTTFPRLPVRPLHPAGLL